MDSVTLQDLANYVNLDRAYLSRYFKKMFSINFSTYLTEIRLNHVAFLLRQTSRSVTDIAYSSGFSDLRTFNKHFLKKFQCSPHEYRKQDDQPRLETADASGTIELYLPVEDYPALVSDFLSRRSDVYIYNDDVFF